MRKVFLLIVISISLLETGNVSGQAYSVSLQYGIPKFIKHSRKSTFEKPENLFLWQAGLSHKTNGSKNWHRYWNQPVIGVNTLYFNFGNDKILGSAFGFLPSISFNFLSGKIFSMNWQIGSGVSYITKPYDKISNPLNNSIGSHWNNVTQSMLSVNIRVIKSLQLSIGGSFTHFSNARISSPNLGINTAGLTFAVLKDISGNKLITKKEADSSSHFKVTEFKKWGGDLMLGYGISEYSFSGGSKYNSYFFSSGVSYNFSPFIRLILGGEYEYNQSVFQFYYQDFDPVKVARQKATKTDVFLAGELFFGHFSARFQTGYYLPFPSLTEKTTPYNFKLNFNVYPFPLNWKINPYFGVLLKSNETVAQYLGLVSGVKF